MSLNAKGPWLRMRALAPLVAGGGGGSIVAVGSVSWWVPGMPSGYRERDC
jgi:NAD(P)-dependent dehydrogenase (short-subunit alcohol dehydrogenase family)